MLRNGRTRRPQVVVSTLALAISSFISMGGVVSARADDPVLERGTFIPTGLHITPSAAPGSSFQRLNPGLSFDPSFTVGQRSEEHTSELQSRFDLVCRLL